MVLKNHQIILEIIIIKNSTFVDFEERTLKKIICESNFWH